MTEKLQAVHHDALGLTGAVFYTPGRLSLRPGMELEVSEPCAVLLVERDGTLRLTVASPERREGELVVVVSLPLAGEGAEPDGPGRTRVTLELPAGPLAGSSVSRTLERPDTTPR